MWASELTRDAVFEAIQSRRCYAISGDKISLDFAVNGVPMGGVAPADASRFIAVGVEGGSSIDYIDVLHNNRLIHRWSGQRVDTGLSAGESVKTHFQVGWGKVGVNVDWDVQLEVIGGELIDVQPRFRGHSIVAPQQGDEEAYQFSSWQRVSPSAVRFATRTWGNVNTTTPGMQGLSLELEGDEATLIMVTINGQTTEIPLSSLLQGPRTGNIGGFVSPAFNFSRAVPSGESKASFEIDHRDAGVVRDWYYIRVRQHNGQWAWSSPVWVEAAR